MSFGFTISDFSIVSELASSIVDACRDGPQEYREICKDVESFRTALEGIADDTTALPPPTEKHARSRKQELNQIIENCEKDLRLIQQLIDRYSRHAGPPNGTVDRINSRRIWDSDQVGSEDLEDARQKLVFHTSSIDHFVDSLQTSDSDVDALSQQMSRRETTLSSTQSQNLELHTQQSGKSSFNFRIDSMQYGTYRSQSACLCVMDVWFESNSGYDLSSGELTISTNFKDLSKPQTAPSVAAFAPHSAEDEDTVTDSEQQPTSNPSWNLSGKRIAIRPATNLNSVRWTVQAATRPWQKPLHQKHRLAFIVEHNGADFAISVTREAALKSLISRMKINHKRRPPTVRLSFSPEASGSILDDINLEALTSSKRRDGRVDSGFYRME